MFSSIAPMADWTLGFTLSEEVTLPNFLESETLKDANNESKEFDLLTAC
jgi:hypothetical protein